MLENKEYKELLKLKKTYLIFKGVNKVYLAILLGITIDNSINLLKTMLSSSDITKNDLYQKYLILYVIPIALALFYDINNSFITNMNKDLEEESLELKEEVNNVRL